MADQLLALPAARQARIGWRLDSGFGTDDAINHLLPHGNPVVVKGFSARRAAKVVRGVADTAWWEVGPDKWVAQVPNVVDYVRRTQTLALAWRTPKGHDKSALLIHQLFDWHPVDIVRFYNARGGMETEIREDKVGLQLVKRRKQAWNAQAAWVVLTDLAHNLLCWLGPWMFNDSTFETFGALRLVQDLLGLPGRLEFGGRHGDRLQKVCLQRTHPFAPEMQHCLQRLFRELKP